jgi:choline dehydrogenase-like flavoprotein
LEPYYTQAEHQYHVHGTRGEDPTEPKAGAPYKYPALRHEPRIQKLHDDWTQLGCRPFHLPVGVMLDEDNPEKGACIRCGSCDGFPCLVNGKADAQVVCVDPALKYPNVSLVTNALVTRLETSGSRREVTGVVVERDGQQKSYKGDVVIVSAGAINSAALLLRSANDKHPNGLANSSDVVGRHYMCHNNSVMLVISRRPNPTVFQKTIGLNDFYHRSDDWDYPLGHISMVGKQDLESLRAGAPPFAPGLALDFLARHSLDFWMTSEDLPDPDNRVLVDKQGNISLHYTENTLEGHRRLAATLKGMLGHIGCERHLVPHHLYLGKKIPIDGTAHQCGTVRFGRDPRTSALDVNCKAHDLDNLYVVDASFFVSSTAVNPSLTIIANALRVGDHLLARLKEKGKSFRDCIAEDRLMSDDKSRDSDFGRRVRLDVRRAGVPIRGRTPSCGTRRGPWKSKSRPRSRNDYEFSVVFDGRHYSIRKYPVSQGMVPSWNQEAFAVLSNLFQMTVTDLTKYPTPAIAIAK